MPEIVLPIKIKASPLTKASDLKSGDRLFYELGYYKWYHEELGWQDWTPIGKFKEIDNPLEYFKEEDRLMEEGFIEHHNFMIVKEEDLVNPFC